MSSIQKIRLAMAGDSCIGKTWFISQHLNEKILEREAEINRGHTFTIGTDYKVHVQQSIKFQIWDLSGHERFQPITDMYFKNIDAVIYMFSFDNYDSFRHLSDWKSRVKRVNSQQLIEVVVGNKVDFLPHEITPMEIQNLLNQPEWKDVPYFECNSIQNTGIDEVFNNLIRQKNQIKPLIKIGSETPLLSIDKHNCCCSLQ